MIEIPTLTRLDAAFGNIDHLPPYDKIPPEFKSKDNDYNKIVSYAFFHGLHQSILKPREGVDVDKARFALQAIMRSWDPQHEHKIAGAAYLMSEWFTINKKAMKERLV